mgnify:CR=1 FL=1
MRKLMINITKISITVVLTILAFKYARGIRGNNAVGGEVFTPFFCWGALYLVPKMFRELKYWKVGTKMILRKELKENILKITQMVLDINWKEEKILLDIFRDYVLFAITESDTRNVIMREQITFYDTNAIGISNKVIKELEKRIQKGKGERWNTKK